MYEDLKEPKQKQPLDKSFRFDGNQDLQARVQRIHRKRLLTSGINERISFSDTLRRLLEEGCKTVEKTDISL